MSQAWKLNEAGVDGVLKKVTAAAEPLAKDLDETKFTDLANAIVGGGSGLQNLVPQVVMELVKDQGENLRSISSHIQAGVLGVTAAKACYHNGNVKMASTVQQHMATSAATGDFSWWVKEGIIKK